MKVLSINGLTKRYGSLTALNGLNLEVEQGQIYGILGPNGSGKTTTLGIVLGITNANAGNFRWFEGKYPAHESLQHVGALLETPNFYPYLNAVDNLKIVAHIKRCSDTTNYQAILEKVNLWQRRTTPFKAYSLGMRQRLAIASTLVGDPSVLIFDEPTNGLDPTGIAEVRGAIQQIAAEGKTILMASHILDEVEKVCSHVAIIKNGNLLTTGEVGHIIGGKTQVEIGAADMDALRNALSGASFIESVVPRQPQVLLVTLHDGTTALDLSRFVFERGIIIGHLAEKKRRLEDEFLAITKN